MPAQLATGQQSLSCQITAPSYVSAAVWLPEQDFTKYGPYDCYYAYRLTDRAGRTVGEGSVLFCARVRS